MTSTCWADAMVNAAPTVHLPLDESSGTTVSDAQGRAVGTYENGVMLAQGGALADARNHAVRLDGVDDRVVINATPALDTDSFSVELWIQPTAGTGDIVLKDRPDAWRVRHLGDGRVRVEGVNGTVEATSAAVLRTGSWNHVAVTFDAAAEVATLYVHGAKQASLAAASLGNAAAAGLVLGGGGAGAFQFLVDEAVFHARALSAAEVLAHQRAGLCFVDEVRADAPAAHWRLGETDGGTVAADHVGNSHGTYVNGVTTGQPGGLDADADLSAAFDGADDHVTVPGNPALDLGDRFTLEAWVRRTSVTNNDAIISKGLDAYKLELEGDSLVLIHAGRVNVLGCGTPLTDRSMWHHVAATRDGPTVKVFQDGHECGAGSFAGPFLDNDLPLTLGIAELDGTRTAPFAGSIDEPAVYPVALSASRLRAHYLAGRAYRDVILVDRPAAFWRLGDLVINLVVNGGFEEPVTTWDCTGPCTPVRSTTWARTGEASLRMNETGGGMVTLHTASGAAGIPVRAGHTYGLSAYVNVVDGAGDGIRPVLKWFNVNGGYISEATRAATTATGEFNMALSGVAPSGASFVQVLFQMDNVGTGDAFDVSVDDVRLDDRVTTDEAGDNDGAYNIDGPDRGFPGALSGDADTSTRLDGDDGITIPDAADLDTGDRFSVEAWVLPERAITSESFFFSKGTGGVGVGFTNTGRVTLDHGTTRVATGSVVVTAGTGWHHVVVTKDGSTARVYVDGADVTVAGTNATVGTNNNPVELGRSGTRYFSGALDEVALYPAALSAAAVALHHEAGRRALR